MCVCVCVCVCVGGIFNVELSTLGPIILKLNGVFLKWLNGTIYLLFLPIVFRLNLNKICTNRTFILVAQSLFSAIIHKPMEKSYWVFIEGTRVRPTPPPLHIKTPLL